MTRQSDIKMVLEIESENLHDPWHEEDFLHFLYAQDCVCMVAEHDKRILGFMVYKLYDQKVSIINLRIAQCVQRNKIGTACIEKLKGKLQEGKREKISMIIREHNVTSQLFLKKQGFQWIETLPEFYDDTPEDAYVMQWKLDSALPNTHS
ncbi:MAG: hypothetical protein A3A98_04280 [Candidatus Staskawiczbacteria bacterium RIFCSPLOWO2_01_FULL_40_39]|uniref:N-acetyltransferase domain-containing protein n=1 Tax=Candidatus Staskawiczbacteria bacterium RIFCSPHIGHO2_01_FULL_39_25 TaxID=1802202 RepID=A0A1G2HNV7_9BACT|nr:MAG: hypothetical protein A2730_03495 [Candidatus Staskawiczbacteria bacterium RIFCSPHIGHO2_01_FULL_39_25]OGZ73992.1 MAG: hypothetical protein A3A98_04280 [Candidatus Staskawiczbacteria bacterium RIFCSPLOWO2_01_FULL_40_39]OGZ76437.1 MAG: hypothetical protein A3I87_02345 [Candidatus Staskawiczbacteria bacterium RIFCSPLOWO2_02_FULL_39_8]